MTSQSVRVAHPYWLVLVIVFLIGAPTIAAAQGAMTNGQNYAASISAPGEIDTWTFTATAGEYIALSIGEVGADTAFWPWIRLLAPNSSLIGNAYGPLAAQISLSAPQTGTYTVLVASNDSGNNDTGDYVLRLAKAPGAFVVPGGDEGGASTNGANHQGVIDRADLDMWTFTANAGDYLALTVDEDGADSAFWPWIRLINPSGTLVGNAYGPLAAQINVTAAATGTYTVILASADSGFAASGNYTFRLAKAPSSFVVPGGDEGGAAVNGANYSGVIDRGDLDMYSFTAHAGEYLALTVGEPGADSAFWPWIRLIGPTGVLLGNAYGTLAAQINVSAGTTGTYTVIVASADSGGDASGNYVFRYARAPGAFTIPVGDEGGRMVPTVSHPGTIERADLDYWTFGAKAGQFLALSIGETGGDTPFWPWIRLVGPTGTLLNSAYGPTAAQISGSAPATGIYRVIVASADSGGDASGTYALTVSGVSTPPSLRSNDDVDGDAKSDRTVFRPSAGVWYSALSDGGATATVWGTSTDIDIPGDYDGDGKLDIAVFRPSDSTWYIVQSSTGTVRIAPWGANGDIPLAGDVDGDGKDDLIVYRPTTGEWFFNKSGGGAGYLVWGGVGDQPMLGDFDGDGKADPTVWRPSNGFWYGNLSNGGALVVGWGTSTDTPVVGDYDADGKSDIGIFRPSTGQWIIKKSTGGSLTMTWGASEDIPIAGDWDADGYSDFTVWRPSTGVWYTEYALGGTAVVSWGANGDRPAGRMPPP